MAGIGLGGGAGSVQGETHSAARCPSTGTWQTCTGDAQDAKRPRRIPRVRASQGTGRGSTVFFRRAVGTWLLLRGAAAVKFNVCVKESLLTFSKEESSIMQRLRAENIGQGAFYGRKRVRVAEDREAAG